MTDYAAAPIQPIVQGLLTIVAGAPVFTGVGATVKRTTGGAALGDFTFTLDPGLPGNAGELAPTGTFSPPVPGITVAAPDPRALVTMRGSLTNAVPGATSINGIGVSYNTPSAPPLGDGGDTTVRVVLTVAGVATDPTGTAASGAEIVIWKGVQTS